MGKNRKFQSIDLKKVMKSKPIVKVIDLTNFSFHTLPSEGDTVEKCYANTFGNCHGGISREHYISENILKQLDTIKSNGIPWLKHLNKNLSANSLTVKSLCERHNSYLSPLDSFAGEFFKEVKGFAEAKLRITIVNGHLLELWLLKVLIGLISTNQLTHKGVQLNSTDIPQEWVEILFGEKSFKSGTGLYISYDVGDKVALGNKISIGPIYLHGKLCGLTANIAGLRLLLSMVEKNAAFNRSHPKYEKTLYRFERLRKQNQPQEIIFKW